MGEFAITMDCIKNLWQSPFLFVVVMDGLDRDMSQATVDRAFCR